MPSGTVRAVMPGTRSRQRSRSTSAACAAARQRAAPRTTWISRASRVTWQFVTTVSAPTATPEPSA